MDEIEAQEETKNVQTLMANYVELFAFICTKKEIEEDKLRVLEIEAKCLYAKTNPQQALDLQMEIQAIKSFLERTNKFCMQIGDKYKRLALSFSNPDCVIFASLFFEGKPPKQVSLELGCTPEYIRKKKSEFNSLIKRELERIKTE